MDTKSVLSFLNANRGRNFQEGPTVKIKGVEYRVRYSRFNGQINVWNLNRKPSDQNGVCSFKRNPKNKRWEICADI